MKTRILLYITLTVLLPQVTLADYTLDMTDKLVNPDFENGINGWTVVRKLVT